LFGRVDWDNRDLEANETFRLIGTCVRGHPLELLNRHLHGPKESGALAGTIRGSEKIPWQWEKDFLNAGNKE